MCSRTKKDILIMSSIYSSQILTLRWIINSFALLEVQIAVSVLVRSANKSSSPKYCPAERTAILKVMLYLDEDSLLEIIQGLALEHQQISFSTNEKNPEGPPNPR